MYRYFYITIIITRILPIYKIENHLIYDIIFLNKLNFNDHEHNAIVSLSVDRLHDIYL